MTKEWKAGDTLEPISLELTLRRAIQAVSGTRDYYPFHHDEQFAKENGAEAIFFNTMFLQGFVGRVAAEWARYVNNVKLCVPTTWPSWLRYVSTDV